MNIKIIPLAGMLALSACADRASEIRPAYVSPIQYQNYNCSQLAAENNRIASRLNQLVEVQDQQATDDAVATGVAIVLFWPAAFFIQGNDNAPEIARLKGQYDAVEQAAIGGNCNGFQRQSAPAA